MVLKENSTLDRYQWTAKKIEEIAQSFLKTNKFTLYDIGARDNILKAYMPLPEISYEAFDLDPLDKNARAWDIEHPFPYTLATPQVITMLEIVEHLKNPWICMKNVFDIMGKGGYLILTTPNPTWSTSRVDLLKKGYLTCFTPGDLELNHHVFTPWPHIVERLLNDCGFEIIEYSTLQGKTEMFDSNLKGIAIPVKLINRFVKKVIERRDKTACGMSYGIIAKKID